MLVGFSSLGSFSSRFRELVGETPTRVPRPLGGDRRAAHPRVLPVHAGHRPLAGRRTPPERAIWEKRGRRRPYRDRHDHQRLPRHRLGHRPGRGQGLLHRQARLPGGRRHHDGRRLPLVHGRPSRPPRAGAHADAAGPAARRGVGRRRPHMLDKGSLGAVGLATDDCRKTHEELSAKGVEFLQEPADRPTASRPSCATTRATGWSWSREAVHRGRLRTGGLTMERRHTALRRGVTASSGADFLASATGRPQSGTGIVRAVSTSASKTGAGPSSAVPSSRTRAVALVRPCRPRRARGRARPSRRRPARRRRRPDLGPVEPRAPVVAGGGAGRVRSTTPTSVSIEGRPAVPSGQDPGAVGAKRWPPVWLVRHERTPAPRSGRAAARRVPRAAARRGRRGCRPAPGARRHAVGDRRAGRPSRSAATGDRRPARRRSPRP